jgi:fused signal recognition particle receptor
MLTELEKGVKRVREAWFRRVVQLFERPTLSETTWDDLEELLITADVGIDTTNKLIERVRRRAGAEKLSDGQHILSVLKDEMVSMLNVGSSSKASYDAGIAESHPWVIMVVGVNGTGKTLSIAKLAAHLTAQGKRVLLAAADTFRAAAIDQLKILGQRAGADVICQKPGADPGAVVFDTLEAARARDADVVIIDTAGRLHTKFNLMEELKKIKRVVSRNDPQSPHEVLLVMDATTGQNGLSQARYFTEAVDVSGIFLTKLDGTAKGGIVLAICDELKVPIRFIGTGESLSDFAPFDARTFVEELAA